MTREEAISRINNDLECHKKELSAPYKTALKMAIEALEFLDKYDEFWEAVKFAGNQGREVDIHHGGRLFKIREVAQ